MVSRSLTRILCVCVSVSTTLNLNSQPDHVENQWPQFRGPNASGIAHQNANPPIKFSEENLLWKIPVPIGHSSPCVWGENIFITAFIKDSSELQTICVDRLNGNINWKQSIFPDTIEGFHPISNAAQTSPATDGERVYVYFGSYGILCYSIKGELLWDYPIKVHPYRWGVTSSPVIHDDKLILCRDIKEDYYLLALDKKTGRELWKSSLPDIQNDFTTSWSTPVVFGDQLVLHRCGEVSSYSLDYGKRIWWFPCFTTGCSSPLASVDKVYIGTWHNFSDSELRSNFEEYQDFDKLLRDFDVNGDSLIQRGELHDTLYLYKRPEMDNFDRSTYATVKQYFGYFNRDKNTKGIDRSEWDIVFNEISDWYKEAGLFALRPGESGEQTLNHVAWRQTEKTPEVPSPILYDGNVYMCENGGILSCLDAETGSLEYRARIGASGPYFASPVAANDFIYIPSVNGIITVIKSGKNLDILEQNDLDERIYASPAIIGNTIIIRTDKHLYTFKE